MSLWKRGRWALKRTGGSGDLARFQNYPILVLRMLGSIRSNSRGHESIIMTYRIWHGHYHYSSIELKSGELKGTSVFRIYFSG